MRSMKVSELIARLQRFDGDQEVRFSYNYGDHGNTEIAAPIREVEELDTEESERHGHGLRRVLDMEDEREFECRDPSKPLEEIVVIR